MAPPCTVRRWRGWSLFSTANCSAYSQGHAVTAEPLSTMTSLDVSAMTGLGPPQRPIIHFSWLG
eukprot:5583556-Lingulodinium_polyedra.AAC.1